MPIKPIDFSCSDGALLLTSKILKYWRGLGYDKVLVEPIQITKGDPSYKHVWGIKSNIGLAGPPK